MAQWIVENWFLIVALAAGVGTIAMAIYKIKQWLLLAVTTAEKELGGGTGQIKLRYVYDMFMQRYPVAAKIVSFDTFSVWVDEALENMKQMLKDNKAAAEYVRSSAN